MDDVYSFWSSQGENCWRYELEDEQGNEEEEEEKEEEKEEEREEAEEEGRRKS